MGRALSALGLLLASLALASAGRHSQFLEGRTRTRSQTRGAEHRLPAAGGDRSVRDFDFFYLVRQWPGNYCSEHACPLLHGHGFHFTIHGLWPNYAAGGWPQFCDPDYKFDEQQIDDLEGAMEEEWPSFMGTDDGFWEHEWTKHGTCSLPVLHSEHKYFKTVLKLHWKYNLAAALRAAEIHPHPDRTYSSKHLVRAIRHMFGVRPLVHCYDNKLSEIWMCIGKDLKPFDCERPSVNDSSVCGDVLTIPPLGKAHKRAQRDAGVSSTGMGGGVYDDGDSWDEEEAAAEWGKAWSESSESGGSSSSGGSGGGAAAAQLESAYYSDGDRWDEEEAKAEWAPAWWEGRESGSSSSSSSGSRATEAQLESGYYSDGDRWDEEEAKAEWAAVQLESGYYSDGDRWDEEEARAEWGKAWWLERASAAVGASDSADADYATVEADWPVRFHAEDLGAEQPIAHWGSVDYEELYGTLPLTSNPATHALADADVGVALHGVTDYLDQDQQAEQARSRLGARAAAVSALYGEGGGSAEESGYRLASSSASRLGGREAVDAEDAALPRKEATWYGSSSADDLPYAVYYDEVAGSSTKSGAQARAAFPPALSGKCAVLVGLALLAVACALLLVVVAMRYTRRSRSCNLLVHDPEGLLRAPLLEHADGKA